ncbi:hypothetical protein LBMAG42_15060 [Deltaproteobacteria bacterium]|nr:hypothetical protein LBMAG42_15060 [Deltaproteobacteria bacterium]
MRASLLVLVALGCSTEVRVPGVGSDPYDSGTEWSPPETGDTGDSAEPADTADTSDSGSDSGEPADTADTGDTGTAVLGPAVVLFIGDGMGFEHVRGGGMYASGAAGSCSMETLPFHGRLRTASLSGTTDSAASATAMATGAKTYNDMLGLDRDGLSVENLVEHARAAGMSVGVVTTDKTTGATPSGFVVHVEDRGDASTIAEAFVASLPDLLFGGSYGDFEPLLAASGAQVVTDSTLLAAASPDGRPLLGLFADTTFPYVADVYPSGTPTLAEMTQKALDWLDDDPEGFFLLVEGARIDHASHSNSEERVFDEVLALDDAVATALAWSGSRDLTMIVTADHECGGLEVTGTSAAGVTPTSAWRWAQHTNADVPIYATGTLTTLFDGERLDQLWVHAALEATINGDSAVSTPTIPLLADGTTADLGAVVVAQAWPTTFGAGYNQLDALRVTADADGLWVGVDGVYERGENAVLVLVDVDYGAGTGLGGDLSLVDGVGALDFALSTLDVSPELVDLGFDVAFGALGAEEVGLTMTSDGAGLRGFSGALGAIDDLGWLPGVSNFDDGNVANGAAASDAGATGLTENGFEALIPWSSVFPTGLPAAGTTVAVSVVLVNNAGDYASNQALPPLAVADEPGAGTVSLAQVVTLAVDGLGAPVGTASVVP